MLRGTEPSSWDSLAPSIAFALKTGSSVISERLPNVLHDYLRHVPNLLVVSDAPAPPPEDGRLAVLDVLHGPAAAAIASVDEADFARASAALAAQVAARASAIFSVAVSMSAAVLTSTSATAFTFATTTTKAVTCFSASVTRSSCFRASAK